MHQITAFTYMQNSLNFSTLTRSPFYHSDELCHLVIHTLNICYGLLFDLVNIF